MSAEIPSQAILAVATVVASLITGMIALVNLTLSKEQKVSEFRQAWIDGLRDDLARFSSSIRFLIGTAYSSAIFAPEVASAQFPRTPEQVASARMAASESLFRIELRLNLAEQNHIELLERLRQALSECESIDATSPSAWKATKSLSDAIGLAPAILKAEWNRVKRGEPIFRHLRVWILPAIVLLSVVLGAFITFGRFHW